MITLGIEAVDLIGLNDDKTHGMVSVKGVQLDGVRWVKVNPTGDIGIFTYEDQLIVRPNAQRIKQFVLQYLI